jgi:hypothetical protein
MSTTRTLHLVAASSLLATVAALAGCSSGGEPSDPHDKLSEVKSALSAPSGKVDALSMKSVSKLYSTMTTAKPVFDALSSLSGAQTKGCLQGAGSSGSYDLACASGGSMTGKVSYSVEGSASQNQAQGTYIVNFDNACTEGTCATGSVIVEASVTQSTVDTTVAFSADLTKDGQKTHLYFGEQANVSSGSVTAKVVVFDNDLSYVISSSVTPGNVQYSVQGSNGSFQCSIGEGTGQCSGAASFSY